MMVEVFGEAIGAVGPFMILIGIYILAVEGKNFIQTVKDFIEYKKEAREWYDEYPVDDYLAEKYLR